MAMSIGQAASMLDTLRRPDARTSSTTNTKRRKAADANNAKAARYVRVPIAWLHGVSHDSRPQQIQRIATIQEAVRGNEHALAKLNEITTSWERVHKRRTRYGSVAIDHIEALGNGTHDVWGDKRTAWARFATYVALRALTSHPKRHAVRASYAQIAALAHGVPKIAIAEAIGIDLAPHHATYRRTQRAIKAFTDSRLVLQWRQAGYRTAFYSYRINSPEIAKAIAADLARAKVERRKGRMMLDAVRAFERITDEQAERIEADVSPHGWHDAALTGLSAEQIEALAKDRQRIGGRTYVMLTRTNDTDRRRARSKLIEAVGRHTMHGVA